MNYDARLLTGAAVLAAVNDAGNFARAGEALGLTPSGVSRAVGRLEARLGVRLFNRTSRSATLTDEGRRFYDQVLPLLAELEAAAASVAGASLAVSGKLRVSVDPWFARVVLAPHLQLFLRRYPDVSLDVLVSNHREELMKRVDVAIRFGPPAGDSLLARKLLETRVVTCAAPSYLAERGHPATPQELADHQTILFRDPQTGLPFAWGFGSRGAEYEVDVRGRVTFDDPTVALEATLAGQGIFQTLALGLDRWIKRGDLVLLLEDSSDEVYPLYVYHLSKRLPAARIRAFLEFLQEIVRSA